MNVPVTLSLSLSSYAALPPLPHSMGEERDLLQPAIQKAGVAPTAQLRVRITKKSIDARKKSDIRLIFQIVLTDEPMQPVAVVQSRSGALSKKSPVVVGFGPAGMFAALHLAQKGLRPVIIERGCQVEKRINHVNNYFSGGRLLPYSNVQFGEGGAGTFSDGKLYSGISDPRRNFILQSFVQCGAPAEIEYLSQPHIGTDRLRSCVKALRKKIEALGGTFLFERTADEFVITDGRLSGVFHTSSTDPADRSFIETEHLLLAIGHSARDTFITLHAAGISLAPKPFAVGLRIEHPQEVINRSQYGDCCNHPALPPAAYKLVAKTSTGRSLYTFCMCPGGYVVAGASAAGQVVTNGMSNYQRDAHNANSALLVGVDSGDFASDHVLAGVRFQEMLEQTAFTAGGSSGYAPCQRFGDFLNNRPTTSPGILQPTFKPGVTYTNLNDILPKAIAATIREGVLLMNNKIRGILKPREPAYRYRITKFFTSANYTGQQLVLSGSGRTLSMR